LSTWALMSCTCLQVIVRDFVSKTIVAQFRAHTSPISALAFDPSGTLLVTASIYGHNLNVFRLVPSTSTSGASSGFEGQMAHVHLYKLYRGVTNAVSPVFQSPFLSKADAGSCL
jgi:WD40 repeat protein